MQAKPHLKGKRAMLPQEVRDIEAYYQEFLAPQTDYSKCNFNWHARCLVRMKQWQGVIKVDTVRKRLRKLCLGRARHRPPLPPGPPVRKSQLQSPRGFELNLTSNYATTDYPNPSNTPTVPDHLRTLFVPPLISGLDPLFYPIPCLSTQPPTPTATLEDPLQSYQHASSPFSFPETPTTDGTQGSPPDWDGRSTPVPSSLPCCTDRPGATWLSPVSSAATHCSHIPTSPCRLESPGPPNQCDASVGGLEVQELNSIGNCMPVPFTTDEEGNWLFVPSTTESEEALDLILQQVLDDKNEAMQFFMNKATPA